MAREWRGRRVEEKVGEGRGWRGMGREPCKSLREKQGASKRLEVKLHQREREMRRSLHPHILWLPLSLSRRVERLWSVLVLIRLCAEPG